MADHRRLRCIGGPCDGQDVWVEGRQYAPQTITETVPRTRDIPRATEVHVVIDQTVKTRLGPPRRVVENVEETYVVDYRVVAITVGAQRVEALIQPGYERDHRAEIITKARAIVDDWWNDPTPRLGDDDGD